MKWLKRKSSPKPVEVTEEPPVAHAAKSVTEPPQESSASAGSPAPAASAPTQHDGDMPLVDYDVMEQARAALKGKFSMIIEFYLEDAAGYIEKMRAGNDSAVVKDIATAAHTLKSSSREVGALKLAALAESIEKDARQHQDGELDFSPRVVEAGIVFEEVREVLSAAAAQA